MDGDLQHPPEGLPRLTAATRVALWAWTGDPAAWFTAQHTGWHRAFTLPWIALRDTVESIVVPPCAAPSGAGSSAPCWRRGWRSSRSTRRCS
ncbi:hypothetical protein ABCS02_01005 [Microbacterium sp. X-17]|uniref:hypothetical protein n=1 Tax=Microbacterium sp. X-17 TaxID=3144404 RepID=UPI0031F4EC59